MKALFGVVLLVLGLLLCPAADARRYGYDDLYANDGTYLGNTNSNPYDPNSVNNPYGKYGSKYSQDLINNPYGQYGSKYSQTSPKNQYSELGRAVSSYGYQQPRNYGGWSQNNDPSNDWGF